MTLKPLMFQDCFLSFCDSLMIACCVAGFGLTVSFFTLNYTQTTFLAKSSKFKEIRSRKRRVLVVIAHPDDECMFFGPSILHFIERENADVYILCLSSGDFYKNGKERIKELWESCIKLGISSDNIILYRCDDLPDNPAVMWPTMHTSRIINHHIHSYGIDMVITFDAGGVSGHINHFAIYNALEHLIEEEELPSNCEVYCLDSVNILRKYSSVFDIFFSYIFSKCCLTVTYRQIPVIQAAMKAHKSQYLWFRRLYIIFSRYVIINTLTKLY